MEMKITVAKEADAITVKKTWVTPNVEVISSNNVEGGTHANGWEASLFPKVGSPGSSVGGTRSAFS